MWPLAAAEQADSQGNLYTGPNTEDTPAIVEATAFKNGIVIAQVNEVVSDGAHDAVRLVEIRGSSMATARPHGGGMIAIDGLGLFQVEAAVAAVRAALATVSVRNPSPPIAGIVSDALFSPIGVYVMN